MNIQDIDPIYVLCFVLLIIIIVLEFRDRQFKNKEEFVGGTWDKEAQSNINFGKPRNFGNFGTDGFYPPKMRCYDKELNFNCSNYEYNWNDKHMNVCSNQCNTNIANLPDNQAIPSTVLGRSAGRPRQCRKLL